LGQRRPRVEFSFFCRNISYKLGLRTKTKVFDSLQEHPIPNAWVDCPIRASIRGSDFKESLDGQYRITSWYNNIELFFFLFFRRSTSKIKKKLINYLINNPMIKFGIKKFTPCDFRFEPVVAKMMATESLHGR